MTFARVCAIIISERGKTSKMKGEQKNGYDDGNDGDLGRRDGRGRRVGGLRSRHGDEPLR